MTAAVTLVMCLAGANALADQRAKPRAASQADVAKLRDTCVPSAARAEVLRAQADEVVLHVYDHKQRRSLAFYDHRGVCVAVRVGRAAARLTAALGTGGTKHKAFILRDCRGGADEDGDDDANCRVAVAVREPSGTMLDAVLLDIGADNLALKSARWLAGEQRVLIASGWIDSFQAVGLARQELAVFRVEHGRLRLLARSAGSLADGLDERCSNGAHRLTLYRHAWKIVKRGAAPIVALTRPLHPADYDPDDHSAAIDLHEQADPGRGRHTTLRYDRDRRLLIPDKQTRPAVMRGVDRCGLP